MGFGRLRRANVCRETVLLPSQAHEPSPEERERLAAASVSIAGGGGVKMGVPIGGEAFVPARAAAKILKGGSPKLARLNHMPNKRLAFSGCNRFPCAWHRVSGEITGAEALTASMQQGRPCSIVSV